MRSTLRALLLGPLAVAAIAALPAACQSGGVGDPCTPEQEYSAHFDGFNIAEAYIESASFQCSTRICLVNHFQGRVSCPLGQSEGTVRRCNGPDDKSCGAPSQCTAAETFTPPCDACDPSTDPGCMPIACPAGLTCDPQRGFCTCDSGRSPTLSLDGANYACAYFDSTCVPGSGKTCTGVLQSYVCHVPGSCQTAGGSPSDNAGKPCCLPGTDTPVSVPVCGQCAASTDRDAANAVYCSCRCGVADGDPPEPDFNFCTCPDGFACTEIRPDLNLGQRELTGKYCVKAGTAFGPTSDCGASPGNHASPCAGATLP